MQNDELYSSEQLFELFGEKSNPKTLFPDDNFMEKLKLSEVLGCRIYALYDLYKNSPGMAFWDFDDAALAYTGNTATVIANPNNFDIDRIATTIVLCTAAKYITCDSSVAAKLAPCFVNSKSASGAYLSYPHSKADIPELHGEKAEFIEDANLHKMFDTLSQSFNDFDIPCETWINDAQKRISNNHGFMSAISNADGNYLAVGGVFAVFDGKALIHSIAVHPSFRRFGYGKYIVAKIIERLLSQNLTPLLMCKNEKALQMYKSLGCIQTGEFTELIL